jgi:hypothetical protein
MATGFLVAFYFLVDFQTLLQAFLNVDLALFGGACVVVVCVRLLMSVRWKVLLDSRSISISLAESIYINFISHSVGFLLPGGVGADLMRGHHAYQKNKELMTVASAIVFDRLIGVFSMLFVACLSSFILVLAQDQTSEIVSRVFWLSALALVGMVLGVLCLYWFEQPIRRRFSGGGFLGKKISKLLTLFDARDLGKEIFSKLLALSLIMQLLRAGIFAFIFMALGIELELIYVFAFTPIVFIVMLIPISIGGIGVREGAIFLLYGALGVSLEQSISAGLLFYGAQVLMIVPGLMLMFLAAAFGGKKARTKVEN